MIYLLEHVHETGLDALQDLIRANGFATLISPDADDPLITHLPLVPEARDSGRSGLIIRYFAAGLNL